MQEDKLLSLYEGRGYSKEMTKAAVEVVRELETYAASYDEYIDRISLQVLKNFVSKLIEEDRNTKDNLLAMARYFYVIANHEIYIYFTSLFGSVGVIPQICQRIERLHGEDAFDELDEVPLGLDRGEMPAYTERFMDRLNETFSKDELPAILAGNNHQIPRETMLAEKEMYEKAPSLDVYLKERHLRKVAELTDHMNEGRIWFEQMITQPVVNHVAADQEILSAVREGDSLYVTKIPFNTEGYLNAEDDDVKRYHLCHCPFVREMLREGKSTVDPNWCYCSAGFAKFPFEVIFDQELDVQLLETPLRGDMRCRFRIQLPEHLS